MWFGGQYMWFGCFINDTLMVVKGVSPNGCASYFQVLDKHRLQTYTFDCGYLQHLQSAPIKVVAKTGKKWMFDPYPSIAHMCDMLQLYSKDLIARLTQDSGVWFGHIPWGNRT